MSTNPDVPTLSLTLQDLSNYAALCLVYSTDVAEPLVNVKIGPDRMATFVRLRGVWIVPNKGQFTDASKIPTKETLKGNMQSLEEIEATFSKAGLLKVGVG